MEANVFFWEDPTPSHRQGERENRGQTERGEAQGGEVREEECAWSSPARARFEEEEERERERRKFLEIKMSREDRHTIHTPGRHRQSLSPSFLSLHEAFSKSSCSSRKGRIEGRLGQAKMPCSMGTKTNDR